MNFELKTPRYGSEVFMPNEAMTPSMHRKYRHAIRFCMDDFAHHGCSVGDIVSIVKHNIGDGRRLYFQIKFHNPTHRNTFLDETYGVSIGKRGSTEIERFGFSLGGIKAAWKNGRYMKGNN